MSAAATGEELQLCGSEAFVQSLCGLVNEHDVGSLIEAQKVMLTRFEKTNEMLINCNALSSARLQVAMVEFRKYTQLIVEMRKDLQSSSTRIRNLKTRLSAQYPHAFHVTAEKLKTCSEEEDDEGAAAASCSGVTGGATAVTDCLSVTCDPNMPSPIENLPVPGNSPSSSCTQPATPSPEHNGSSSSTE